MTILKLFRRAAALIYFNTTRVRVLVCKKFFNFLPKKKIPSTVFVLYEIGKIYSHGTRHF